MQLSTASERKIPCCVRHSTRQPHGNRPPRNGNATTGEHIARLTTILGQAHQQNQRLLDLPRTSPSLRPQDAPGATQAPRRAQRKQAHRTRRQATPVVPCAGHRGPTPGASGGARPPRCGRCSAWRGAWPIRVWGCCGMGWCSGWDGGDMCQHSHHKPTDHKDIIMTLFVGNSACTEDQRADTLTYCLAVLTRSSV